MKIFFFGLTLSLFLVLGGCQRQSSLPVQESGQQTQSETVDFQAAFAIFTNGTFRIFSAEKYHNRSPNVFLTAENPNIIYVKGVNITWQDFFETLPAPFTLTATCLTTGTGQNFCDGDGGFLKFYLNGAKITNPLGLKINAQDKLLVTFGNETEEEIKNQFSQIPN